MKFFPGDQESSFAFFSLSCVWSTCPLLATAWSCARHAAAQPGPRAVTRCPPHRVEAARLREAWRLGQIAPGSAVALGEVHRPWPSHHDTRSRAAVSRLGGATPADAARIRMYTGVWEATTCPSKLGNMTDVERATRLQRLDDSTSSLLEAYAKLIKSAQVHGATEQQVSSFQSSVLVAGLVSTANLG